MRWPASPDRSPSATGPDGPRATRIHICLD
jgi:hypothetical protein